MKVISFLNHKGGVGKTTLCTNIAHGIYYSDRAQTILLVDADPQGSLRDWHNARAPGALIDGINVVGADRASTLLNLPQIVTPDYMLIDTPGDTKEKLHGAALQMSNVVIIPLSPSPYDIWAAEETIDLVRTAKSVNPKLKMMILLNMAQPNTRIHKEVKELLSTEYKDFTTFQTSICKREVFKRTAAIGSSAFEDREPLGASEIAGVTSELLDCLYEVSHGYHPA